MRNAASNPERNQLPKGIDEKELIGAIESSGYPLQGLVASILNDRFAVSEEWGYIDRDTKEHRSLDVFAYKKLGSSMAAPVQPNIALLIECKRSRHPYIFFQSIPNRAIPRFPSVAGLPSGGVSIHEAGGNRSIQASGALALGIDKLPFVEPGPPKCAAFTKAIPSGKRVELSGSDPFNTLVLPLVKAQVHAAQLYKVADKPTRLFPTLLHCVSVLDAPILLVEKPEDAANPVFTPWVRIVRQEADPDPFSWNRFRFYSIDAVHIDYFPEYVTKHVLPFAEEYGKRAIAFDNILFGGGQVSSLDNWSWDEVKPRTATT